MRTISVATIVTIIQNKFELKKCNIEAILEINR